MARMSRRGSGRRHLLDEASHAVGRRRAGRGRRVEGGGVVVGGELAYVDELLGRTGGECRGKAMATEEEAVAGAEQGGGHGDEARILAAGCCMGMRLEVWMWA